MSPTSAELRAQLQALQKALEEQERIEKEEAEKLAALEPFIISIDTFNSTRRVFAVKTVDSKDKNVYREGYNKKVMSNLYSRRWMDYVKMFEVSINDYYKFKDNILNYDEHYVYNITKAEEELVTYLNTPDVKVDYINSEFIIKLKDLQLFSDQIFGALPVRYRPIEQYFTLPYNEGGRLLTRLNEIESQGRFKVEWEPLAIEQATEELENRNKINEIATLTYNPEYDFDLNGNKLHKFQTVGVGFVDYSLFTLNNTGVNLQDEMGLGKSPQALAVAVKRNARTLILTPAAGRDNWFDYVKKFTGQTPKMFQKTEPDKFDFQDMLVNKVQFNLMAYDTIARPKKILEDDNITVKDERYLWADLINLSRFDIIICDEAHKLKNTEAGRTIAFLKLNNITHTKFIFLSGTPILNRPAEFWPVLSKCDSKSFSDEKSFIWRYSDGKNGAKNVTELRELIKPFTIRRKKSEVLPDLPPVIPMNEYYIMNDKEQELYDSVLNQVLDAIYSEGLDDDRNFDKFNFFASNFLVKIMRLKQVCSAMVTNAVSEFAFEAYHNSESEHKKVIIFSQFVPIVHTIKNKLGNEALFITGEDHNPSERLKIVKEFNADPFYKYLVASTKAASEQLNITSAGTVLFTDLMWTPADHDQAIGRAYGRLNDCHGVDAHFFIVKDTIMEWIVKLLSEKSQTFKQVVEGEEGERMRQTSVIQDLIKMLRQLKRKK